ncbi:hypothetical protein KFL_007780010, partial [Klebsormidium nitens]
KEAALAEAARAHAVLEDQIGALQQAAASYNKIALTRIAAFQAILLVADPKSAIAAKDLSEVAMAQAGATGEAWEGEAGRLEQKPPVQRTVAVVRVGPNKIVCLPPETTGADAARMMEVGYGPGLLQRLPDSLTVVNTSTTAVGVADYIYARPGYGPTIARVNLLLRGEVSAEREAVWCREPVLTEPG